MSGLEGYSPFDVGLGKFANYIELGLGVERGFMKIWKHGQLEVWGNDDDPNGEPGLTFTPDDAELLRELANELESRAGEYAEWKREQDKESRDPAANSQQGSKNPQIIAGPAASEGLNNFCLK